MKTSSTITIQAWQLGRILLEKYDYSEGTVEPLPKHSHQEYQLGLSFNCQGEYFYRGAYHPIPIGNLSIIHSGEVHSPSERTYLPEPATFWMMHIDSNLLQGIASEIAQKPVSMPFFTKPVLNDNFVGLPQRNLNKLFQNMCIASNTNVTRLTIDSLILDFCSHLITYKTKLSLQNYQTVKPAIAIVCDFLQAHYRENISLAELSNRSQLSRFYLSRLFHREMGISLSAYQTQIRIDRAKKLLTEGRTIAQVASEIGFYDQSHFGFHFKRLVGTTPGNYRKVVSRQ